jgi:hypothetical protein
MDPKNPFFCGCFNSSMFSLTIVCVSLLFEDDDASIAAESGQTLASSSNSAVPAVRSKFYVD